MELKKVVNFGLPVDQAWARVARRFLIIFVLAGLGEGIKDVLVGLPIGNDLNVELFRMFLTALLAMVDKLAREYQNIKTEMGFGPK